MNIKFNEVMSSLKGSNSFNVLPTKDTVDYTRIYFYNDSRLSEKFRLIKGNREPNKSHINEIKRSIMNEPYNSLYIAPIRVDINTFNVLDGQHRLLSFRKAWADGCDEPLKVIFEDAPIHQNETLDVIVAINTTQKNWGIKAYEHRLREIGDDAVKKMDEFGKSHYLQFTKSGEPKPNPRYTYALLFGKNVTKEIKDGTISLTEEDILFGDKIHKEVSQMKDVLLYEVNGVSWLESFTCAWWSIRKNDFIYNEILEKIGVDNFIKTLPEFFDGYQYATRKTEWETRFRTAIGEMKRTLKK